MVLAERRPPEREEDDERHRSADERDPRRDAGPAVPQAVLEVAGPLLLQDDPGDERQRNGELATGDERRDARERERERDESRQAPRLRQRHRVRDVHEEPGHEHEEQDDQAFRRA